MKFKISSEKFKKIVSFTARLCSNNPTIPILNNILLELDEEKLYLSSTNLEVGIKVSTPVQVEEKGKVSLPGRILADFVSNLPNKEVEIDESKLNANIKCGDLEATINGQDPKDYPDLPKVKEENIISLSPQVLVPSLSKVSSIVAPSDARVEISGVLMKFEDNNLKLAGTDSIRLTEKTINLEQKIENKSVIVPIRAVNEANYIFSSLKGNIGVSLDDSQISFDFTSEDESGLRMTLISKLIEGQFPQYQEIIPQTTNTKATIDKEEFQKKVKVASLFSSQIQDVKVSFNPSGNKNGSVSVSAASSGIGSTSSEVSAKVEGEAVDINFNWKYILDGLGVIDSSEIFFGVNDATSPAVFKPVGDESFIYILMPKTV